MDYESVKRLGLDYLGIDTNKVNDYYMLLNTI